MPRGTVGIAALKLVDPATRKILSHERWLYALELTRLLSDLDYRVSWWQIGNGWQAELVPGVPLAGILDEEMQLHTWPRASEGFLEKAGWVDWAIYFDFILGYPQAHEVSLAVCHDLRFDDPQFESSLPAEEERSEWKRRLWMALRAPRRVVAVEPGIIHWAMATWPGLYHQFLYIPPFCPAEVPEEFVVDLPAGVEEAQGEGVLRVLFPGELTPASGISETVRAMEVLLDRYPNLQFMVTGQGSEAGASYMRHWVSKRSRAFYAPGFPANSIFQHSDIVLFPEKGSQGAHGTCLKAMAAGKPVIVGQSGSLTGLVLNGYNGITIRPEGETIVEAVDNLICDAAKRKELGERAREVAQGFSVKAWRRRWTRAIEDLGMR